MGRICKLAVLFNKPYEQAVLMEESASPFYRGISEPKVLRLALFGYEIAVVVGKWR